MEEQTEKRKRGRPPWTEEQKQARRELNAKIKCKVTCNIVTVT